MIYELRVYHCLPGKLPAVNDRFKNITTKIWERFGIKAVGFVTAVMKDGENNDSERVAVFVPTTPNPTGGFLLILPSRDVIPTDWSMDQAMSFIISGGAAAPERMPQLST